MRRLIAAIGVVIVVLAAVAFLLLRAFGREEVAPVRPTEAVPPASDVVAAVNGEAIQWGELIDEILRVYRAEASFILDQQIRDTIIAQEAKRKGVTVTEEEVEAKLREYDQRVRAESGGAMTLEEACKREGQTMDQIRQELRMTTAREKLMRLEGVSRDGPITDEMILAWDEGKKKEAKIRGATQGLPPHLVAVVNGEEIPKASVVGELLGRMVRPAIEGLLDEMITDRLFEQHLKERGLRVTEAEVNQLIQTKREMMRRNPTYRGQTLEQALKAQGKSIADLEAQFRRTIAMVRLFGDEIPEEKIREMFELGQDGLSGKRVRASHIVAMSIDYKTKKSLGPAADAKARRKIEDIRKKLDAGARFEELAVQYSEDPPSAAKGGDLGFVLRRGTVADALADALFEMKKGEIRSPVRTEYGYHIVKVTDIDPGKSISFSTERFKLMVQYVGMRANEPMRQAWVDKLRAGARIEKYIENIGRDVEAEPVEKKAL